MIEHVVIQLLLIASPDTAAAVREHARASMVAAGCARPVVEMRMLTPESLEVFAHCPSPSSSTLSDHVRDVIHQE